MPKPEMEPKLPNTLREAYLQASSFLAAHGVDEAPLNAELLLQHLLGISRTALLFRLHEPFPAERMPVWAELLQRRAAGEPVQYITGEQEFYGLPFAVSPAVLIPRPETELLVEAIVRRGAELWPEGTPYAADLGTGSGVIAVTLAVQRPRWRLGAVDLSSDALQMARRNAERNGVAERIAFWQGDFLKPLIRAGRQIDILVSNPPYIRADELPQLQREVRSHEPHLALVGGADGLSCYRLIVKQLRELPAFPALLGFEVGQGQAEEVAAMLQACGFWEEITAIRDLAGIDRHVVAVRKQG